LPFLDLLNEFQVLRLESGMIMIISVRGGVFWFDSSHRHAGKNEAARLVKGLSC
jgi:hypothetical protein